MGDARKLGAVIASASTVGLTVLGVLGGGAAGLGAACGTTPAPHAPAVFVARPALDGGTDSAPSRGIVSPAWDLAIDVSPALVETHDDPHSLRVATAPGPGTEDRAFSFDAVVNPTLARASLFDLAESSRQNAIDDGAVASEPRPLSTPLFGLEAWYYVFEKRGRFGTQVVARSGRCVFQLLVLTAEDAGAHADYVADVFRRFRPLGGDVVRPAPCAE